MLALAIPLATVSFGAWVGLFERIHSQHLQEDLRLEIERTARIGGQMLASPMWYVNQAHITDGLSVLLDHEDVLATVSRDADGGLLAWCSKTPAGQVECGAHGLPADFSSDGPATTLSNSHIESIYFGEPQQRQGAGQLQVFYSDARVRELMRQRLRHDLVFFGLLVLSLVAGIFLATRRGVLMPLKRWHQALKSSRGQGLQKVDWVSADEVGELIREYNARVDEERRKARQVGERLKVLESGLESLHRGVCIFDRDFQLVAFNERYLEILGHAEDVVEPGMSLKSLLRANAAQGEYGSASIDAVIIDRLAIASANQRYRRERERLDGTVIEVESCPTPGGGFISIYTDITEQRSFESQMRRLALGDTITGLPNRALFHDRLQQALALSDRIEQGLALLLVDLDDFRDVNDNQGREVGDAVLRETASRLRALVRKSDTAARLEGDLFAVIQQYVGHADEAALLAHRILGSLSRVFEIGDLALRLTATVGITVYPDDDRMSRNILKNAHLALTCAKSEGSHRYRFFVPEVDHQVDRRRHLEEELFNALRDDQLVLSYQPRIVAATGELAAVEALVEWDHPQRGRLPSSEFLPLAEDRGLIAPVTEWMLRAACRERRAWQDQDSWPVAVPLPASFLAEGPVADTVRGALESTDLDPRYLALELGADAMIRHADQVTQELEALRETGIGSIVVDFGDGTSPFRSIRHLSIDAIKLDRQWVRDLVRDDKAEAIVKAVIDVGQKLGLKVTAAGVDEAALLERLKEEKCDEVQGRAVSEPLSADGLAAWISDRTASRISS